MSGQLATATEVRFWDFPRHFAPIESEIMGAIQTMLRAGDLVMRQQLRDFERELADYIGTSYAVGVSSCTDALRLTLEALGVGPGDEVITVSHTFVATLAAVHHLGATPVLVDIGSDHLVDVAAIEAAITERTRGIIPVHLNGRTCQMDRLMAIADANGLFVLEDAAQAVGARFDGQRTGTFGVASCYSFYPAKLLGALGDGGAVVTNDAELAATVRRLRDHGRVGRAEVDGWGWNCRLDNVQAGVLSVKLRHVPEWIESRRAVAARYQEGLEGLAETAGIVLPPPPDQGTYYDVFQNYVIEAPRRDELADFLTERKIETMISWPVPVHHQPGLGLDGVSLPVTEALCRRVLSLPMYPELDDGQVDWIVESVRDFYDHDA